VVTGPVRPVTVVTGPVPVGKFNPRHLGETAGRMVMVEGRRMGRTAARHAPIWEAEQGTTRAMGGGSRSLTLVKSRLGHWSVLCLCTVRSKRDERSGDAVDEHCKSDPIHNTRGRRVEQHLN